ncbi:subtilisin-like protease-like protein, partial [Trifolium pratense]
KGKIVGCDREGNIKSVAEGQEALSAGAKGMLLSNRPQQGKTTLAEPHVLSCVGNGQDENTPVIINTTEPAGSHAAYDITSM